MVFLKNVLNCIHSYILNAENVFNLHLSVHYVPVDGTRGIDLSTILCVKLFRYTTTIIHTFSFWAIYLAIGIH